MTTIPDERLALVFTCCHPALAPDAQVALTLREVGGPRHPEIARAFLLPEATLAQRLVRAKRTHPRHRDPVPRAARSPAPGAARRGARASLYLVFNEGYAASAGRRARAPRPLRRGDPTREAAGGADAGRAGGARAPRAPAAAGLPTRRPHGRERRPRPARRAGPVALGRRRGSRRAPRARARGATRPPGPFQLQAAIAAAHAEELGWEVVERLYAPARAARPSPVVRLNRAVAVALGGRLEEGLATGRRDRRALRLPVCARHARRPPSPARPAGATRRRHITTALGLHRRTSPSADSSSGGATRSGGL